MTSPKSSTPLDQAGPPSATPGGIRLGLRANLAQFTLLVAVNGLVGGMLGQERTVAVIGDVAHPAWRARAVGVYRLWRDGGFAIGALLAGIVADAYNLTTAIWAVAALTAPSGLIVAIRMYETHPRT